MSNTAPQTHIPEQTMITDIQQPVDARGRDTTKYYGALGSWFRYELVTLCGAARHSAELGEYEAYVPKLGAHVSIRMHECHIFGNRVREPVAVVTFDRASVDGSHQRYRPSDRYEGRMLDMWREYLLTQLDAGVTELLFDDADRRRDRVRRK